MRNKKVKNIHTVPGVSIIVLCSENHYWRVRRYFYFLYEKEK